MATIKVLRDCVVAHQRRIPGELVTVDEYTARRMADDDPETFEWVDRPVKQFVDVAPEAPVGEDEAQSTRTSTRQTSTRRRKKAEPGEDGAEVSDAADESAG